MSENSEPKDRDRRPLSDRRTVASKFEKKDEDTDPAPSPPPRQPGPPPGGPFPPPPGHSHQEGFSIGNTRPKQAASPSPQPSDKPPAQPLKSEAALSAPSEPKHGRNLLRESGPIEPKSVQSTPRKSALDGDSLWDRFKTVLIVGLLLVICTGGAFYLVTNKMKSQGNGEEIAAATESEDASLVSRPTSSRAQSTTNPVAALIEDNTTAMGGYERIKRFSSVAIRGTLETEGKVITFSLYGRRPDFYRIVYELSEREQYIVGYDGQTAWQEWRRDGTTASSDLLSAEATNMLRLNTDFDLPPQRYLLVGEYSKDRKSMVLNVDSLTRDMFKGKTYDVYKIHEAGRPSITCYQDLSSNLLAQTITRLEGNDYRVSYENYRKVDGVYFSHLRSQYMNGMKTAEVRIDSVEFNPGLMNTMFSPPKSEK